MSRSTSRAMARFSLPVRSLRATSALRDRLEQIVRGQGGDHGLHGPRGTGRANVGACVHDHRFELGQCRPVVDRPGAVVLQFKLVADVANSDHEADVEQAARPEIDHLRAVPHVAVRVLHRHQRGVPGPRARRDVATMQAVRGAWQHSLDVFDPDGPLLATGPFSSGQSRERRLLCRHRRLPICSRQVVPRQVHRGPAASVPRVGLQTGLVPSLRNVTRWFTRNSV